MTNLHRCFFLLLAIILATQSAFANAEKKPAAETVKKAEPNLVYTSRRDGKIELVLAKEDGKEIKTLSTGSSRNTFPSWSPDGKRIVYKSTGSFGDGLFVMDSDGGNIQHLTHGPDVSPAWSPDGKKIAYSHPLGNNDWCIMSITMEDPSSAKPANDDSEIVTAMHVVTQLTPAGNYDADPAWSPDSKRIAFASNRGRGGGFRLYVMDADGKNVYDLSQADNPGGNTFPCWAPDGKQIVYTDWASDETRQIYVVNIGDNKKRQLTKKGYFNCFATWSPDGKKIAYMFFENDQARGDLMLMNADGSDQRLIGKNVGAGRVGRPAWKPVNRSPQ